MPQYKLVLCPDDHTVLREILNEIGESGGRIISLNWEPERTIPAENSKRLRKASGYSIVVEELVDARDPRGLSGTVPRLPPGR
ncbi:MAG: hypothetical protein K0R27_1411 [Xanthobacteraceae bacterium]|nr:hypothetical protein [Xanthobacteraceae bacterium]